MAFLRLHYELLAYSLVQTYQFPLKRPKKNCFLTYTPFWSKKPKNLYDNYDVQKFNTCILQLAGFVIQFKEDELSDWNSVDKCT